MIEDLTPCILSSALLPLQVPSGTVYIRKKAQCPELSACKNNFRMCILTCVMALSSKEDTPKNLLKFHPSKSFKFPKQNDQIQSQNKKFPVGHAGHYIGVYAPINCWPRYPPGEVRRKG